MTSAASNQRQHAHGTGNASCRAFTLVFAWLSCVLWRQ